MTYASDSYIFLINGCTTSTPIAFFHGFIASSQANFFTLSEADIVAQDARQVLDLGTRLESVVHYLPNFLSCLHFDL